MGAVKMAGAKKQNAARSLLRSALETGFGDGARVEIEPRGGVAVAPSDVAAALAVVDKLGEGEIYFMFPRRALEIERDEIVCGPLRFSQRGRKASFSPDSPGMMALIERAEDWAERHNEDIAG
jgi:hypothetical protein